MTSIHKFKIQNYFRNNHDERNTPLPISTVADILIEALPYIRKFSGMTVVVKYGGHAMVDEQLKTDFARDITLLKFIGLNPVVVHGGAAPRSTGCWTRWASSPQFVRGMRSDRRPHHGRGRDGARAAR